MPGRNFLDWARSKDKVSLAVSHLTYPYSHNFNLSRHFSFINVIKLSLLVSAQLLHYLTTINIHYLFMSTILTQISLGCRTQGRSETVF